ncbi:hypothetical protein [Thermococcus sp. Bubb.Bath]|uniref:hypothetical protein n=1 Tax=Thermococcus sp. Bubb.Bath TaxID=1638242 RepID=UPI00143B8036|nr:hypothetical protein [Thermococcus sp. Bubb.Bath]NJF24821.1 hypothetical protein [Thermococcus sp. Bubb.Bath]
MKFLKWYLKVFASFLFLLLLISTLPVATVSVLTHMNERTLGKSTASYVYVTFYTRPVKAPVVYLNSPDLPYGYGGIKSYLGESYSYWYKPEFLMKDAERALARAEYNGSIYVPVEVGSLGGVLLPVNGSPLGPDCIILGNQSLKIGNYTYLSKVHYSDDNFKFVRGVAEIDSIRRISNLSPDLLPLIAFMKSGNVTCIASGGFYGSILRNANLSPTLDHLVTEGFLLVSPNNINTSLLYKTLYDEFIPHSYYPVLYVLEPGFVKDVLYPERTNYWADFLKALVVLLPALPLIGLAMAREGREEEKLRNLLEVAGGNPIILDLLTLFFVGTSVLISLIFVPGVYSATMMALLAGIFAFRYYGRGLRVSSRMKKLILWSSILTSAFAFIVSSVYWSSFVPYDWSAELTEYATFILVFPFKALGEYVFGIVGATVFGYLPWLAGAILSSLLFMVYFSRSGRPTWRATARATSSTLAVMIVFALFSGVAFSSPVMSLYQSVTNMNIGSTAIVHLVEPPFKMGAPRNLTGIYHEQMKIYAELTQVITQNGGRYGTLWNPGLVVKKAGMTRVMLGYAYAYDESLIDYLRSARSRCRDARWTYALLMNSYRSKKAITYGYFLRRVQHNGEEMRVTLSNEGEEKDITLRYMESKVYLPFGGDVTIPLNVLSSQNITALPGAMFVYGGKNVLNAIKQIQKEHPGRVVYKSVEYGTEDVVSRFIGKRNIEIPMVASTVLVVLIGIALGIRDGRELKRKKSLFQAVGLDGNELTAPLVSFLPLSLVAAPMLRDAYEFYSLGFISSPLSFAILVAPLVGVVLAPVLYIWSLWRCLK